MASVGLYTVFVHYFGITRQQQGNHCGTLSVHPPTLYTFRIAWVVQPIWEVHLRSARFARARAKFRLKCTEKKSGDTMSPLRRGCAGWMPSTPPSPRAGKRCGGRPGGARRAEKISRSRVPPGRPNASDRRADGRRQETRTAKALVTVACQFANLASRIVAFPITAPVRPHAQRSIVFDCGPPSRSVTVARQ